MNAIKRVDISESALCSVYYVVKAKDGKKCLGFFLGYVDGNPVQSLRKTVKTILTWCGDTMWELISKCAFLSIGA